MKKAILTKLSSNPNALRTDTVEGEFNNYPKVGESFYILAKPLNPDADVRVITTSLVKSVSAISKPRIVFTTMNSEYALDIVERDNQEYDTGEGYGFYG